MTTVASFLNSLKCKLVCETATQTFYHQKVTQLREELLSHGCDGTWHEVEGNRCVFHCRGLPTFLWEGHIDYYTTIRGPHILRDVTASAYKPITSLS